MPFSFVRYSSRALIAIVIAVPAAAAEPAPDSDTPAPGETTETWVDHRHEQLSNQADKLAGWIDGFFSESRSVEDSPSSLIRIRPEYTWDDDDGGDWRLRATGRLYLPAMSDRLSVVFMGGNSGFDETFYDPGITSDNDSAVGIQYQVRRKSQSRIDLTAGIKARFKGKLGARYLYLLPLTEKNRLRFSEEGFWIGGDGFGTLTRVDLDHVIDDNTLIRLANKALYSQESNGVEWTTRLAWAKRLNDKRAVRAYVFMRGETSPRYLSSRGLGASYRRKFLRRWLFWEIEPYYEWRKYHAGDNRDGIFGTDFRVEVVLGSRELDL